MEKRVIEVTGKSVEEAVEIAKKTLELKENEKYEYEVLNEETKGFLGIGFLGGKKARIRFTIKPKYENYLTKWIEEIIDCTGRTDVEVKVRHDNRNKYFIDINGENLGFLIGRRGAAMYAIEHLLSLMLNKKTDSLVRVKVNVSKFKQERQKDLEEMAIRLAEKAASTKKAIFLRPMNSFERKIIHKTLKTYRNLYTYSKGAEPNRKVVISPKDFKKKFNKEQTQTTGDVH
ncbi:Jag N-terminal domain-containing protein [bacterium]|nr:Jag N-terminal domain-containing protein [bacterium]